MLEERDLTDILLTHSLGFDRELDARILAFYDRIAQLIQRSLDLGISMGLVRQCDTRMLSYCILGGIKEAIGQLARESQRPIEPLVDEVLNFGLRGVARPELLSEQPRIQQSDSARQSDSVARA